MQEQLDSWWVLNLSWLGHITAVKKKILTKFIFLFRLLVLTLPEGILKEIQHFFLPSLLGVGVGMGCTKDELSDFTMKERARGVGPPKYEIELLGSVIRELITIVEHRK